MSFFNKIFGSSENEKGFEDFWTEIKGEEQLEDAINQSYHSKVVIFKHSTRCMISKTVLKNFEKEAEHKYNDDISYFYLDLLAHRDISNKISEQFDVQHQSPQMIVLKDGKVVNHASHNSISPKLI